MTIASEILSIISSMLEPTPLTILFSVLLVVTLPILLHLLLNSTTTSHTLPTILLLGPSGSGKTSLLTLFETGTVKPTQTSQTALTVECSLPTYTTTTSTSSQYRSKADPASQTHTKFLLADTPGHSKLRRQHALAALNSQPQNKNKNNKTNNNIKGIIFLLDAADLSPNTESLRLAAEYLHDILLLLQQRIARSSSSSSSSQSTRKPKTKILLAANKSNLFTAMPAKVVKRTMEEEVGRVREGLSRGLLDSGVGEVEVEEMGWLGERDSGGSGEGETGKGFRFEELEEFGVEVQVRGGSVLGSDSGDGGGNGEKKGADVEEWWRWIGECL